MNLRRLREQSEHSCSLCDVAFVLDQDRAYRYALSEQQSFMATDGAYMSHAQGTLR